MMYLWIIIVLILLIGMRRYKGRKISENGENTIYILDEKYINGKISKEEYLKQKETLNSNK